MQFVGVGGNETIGYVSEPHKVISPLKESVSEVEKFVRAGGWIIFLQL